MRATEILSQEHRVIETVLDCLQRMSEDCASRRRIDPRPAQDAIRFVRTFADACHHRKEEDLLFAKLVERGLPRHVGPLAVMLEEHEEGRALVRRMDAAVADRDADPAGAALHFAEAAAEYVQLLREHIHKEDGVLYTMADGMLREGDQLWLLERFEAVEHGDALARVHEEMLALADALAREFGVVGWRERAPVAAAAGCGGGRHSCRGGH